MIVNPQHNISQQSYMQPSYAQPSYGQQSYMQQGYQPMYYQQPMVPMYVPYGYPGMPYNPQFLMNQPPINNYNRNILNGDYTKQYVINEEINTSKRAISSKNRDGGNYGDISNNESRRRHTNNESTFKPYSLKDYKQIASTKIVLGGLGANIGTKEWEEKQRKMKKMEEYASSVSKNKIILKVKKEEPSQLIEKERKEKMDHSVRTKAYEYARLIRPKSKIHYNNEDLLDVNENKNINNSRYGSNTSELDIMQRKRENLRFQIDEIKESLLK
jgi:hypothetical protein